MNASLQEDQTLQADSEKKMPVLPSQLETLGIVETAEAHAYTQGSEIHLGAGQERHLPHEAWHVVQQAQGRVRPTLQE